METESKKARVLCLHGYRQCAKTFKEKLGAFRKLLKTHVEFYFVDAPLAVNNEVGDENERSWWFTTQDSTFSSSHKTNSCVGFESSVEKVRLVCTNDGPFDGLLGFSQGAAFAAILCAMKVHDFKFVILIAGFKSLVAEHLVYYENIVKIPSLHIIGESDTVIIKQKSEDLRDCFETDRVETLIHERGHYVPANKHLKQNYTSFIEKYR